MSEIDVLTWLDDIDPTPSALEVRAYVTDTLTSHETSGTCFEVTREVLLNLLEKAIPVVPTRDMIPVLNNFQIQASEKNLKVIASSTEMSIELNTSQVNTKVPGTEVFPAKTLLSIVKETNAGSTIYIEVTSLGAVIVAGNFSAEVRLSSGKGFPKLDTLNDVKFYSVVRSAFVDAVSTVRYALPNKDFSGQDSMRFISIRNGKFTACDGSRFQQTRIEGMDLSMQLPTDNIATILKVLTSTDQEYFEVGEIANKLIFRLDNVVLYMNKKDSIYPNVEQLWLRPALANNQELTVNRQELLTAIKQVRIAAQGDSNAVGLIVDSESLKVIAKDMNNTAEATIACKWAGKPRNIVVHYIHLAEMLKAYNNDECIFMLGEDTKTYKSPILLKNPDTLAIATISQLVAYHAGLV